MAHGEVPLLEVRDLATHYPLTRGLLRRRTIGAIRAVDGVSFELRPGETLGLVGESGCGKSTLARTLIGLETASAGTVRFAGRDVLGLGRAELRALRRRVQIVFQDPYASLNPRMTVGDIIAEPWTIHRDLVPRSRRRDRAAALLEQVGLRPAYASRYPHQLSGGQRQRIGIARALALEPELLICDEPVSALDVSIQAQVINLLEDLRGALGLAYLFIAHDLAVVEHLCDRVAVMYLGRIVEQGTVSDVFNRPRHPYTRALLSASPVPDPQVQATRARIRLEGEPPSPANPPSGCHFRTRCWKARAECAAVVPGLEIADRATHLAACHFPEA